VKHLKDAGLKVLDASFERNGDLDHVLISVYVSFKNGRTYYALERELEQNEKFQLVATREE